MLHEAFDIVLARMRGVAKALRNFRLDIEGEAFFCFKRCKMHVATHSPKEIFGLVEKAQFGS